MGALTERREGLKTHWRNLSARARLGECFGFLDALAVFYKAGHISREIALEMLHRHASPDELKEYRRVRGLDPIG
jgi:divalent metal cation (Fe/Co/Zn/Cd) transporter